MGEKERGGEREREREQNFNPAVMWNYLQPKEERHFSKIYPVFYATRWKKKKFCFLKIISFRKRSMSWFSLMILQNTTHFSFLSSLFIFFFLKEKIPQTVRILDNCHWSEITYSLSQCMERKIVRNTYMMSL